MTATIFASEKDDAAFRDLEKEGKLEKTDVKGIYLVKGIIDMPFQIVMTGEIEGKEYAAYRVLRAQVDEKDVDYLLEELRKATDPEKRNRLRGLLGIVETKHAGMVWKKIEEDEKMRDVFMELLKPQIDEKIITSRRNDLYDYVQKGGMSIDFAAKKAGITTDAFRTEMTSHGYRVPEPA